MDDLKLAARRALTLMDLTSLGDDDTREKIAELCRQARSPEGQVAALCIYPRFIPHARKVLAELGVEGVRIATVTNFPHGDADVDVAVAETRAAIAYGADEVDVVFPYRALMAGDEAVGARLVAGCKKACGDKRLKVIVETGELKSTELIARASRIALDNGADFIKTSSGKVAVNATPEAAEVMLTVLRDSGRRDAGFKPAGGVRTAEDAAAYLAQAERIMGQGWVDAEHFRFGASSLLASLQATLRDGSVAAHGNGY